nr:DDE-type integrase/transposase/recombinase [Actinomyces qiguomingii]
MGLHGHRPRQITAYHAQRSQGSSARRTWSKDTSARSGPTSCGRVDITYVRTLSGWVYVAFITDVYSRRIVGWQTSTSLYTDLALDALKMGIWQRQREGADLKGLIHHSDRGVQYRAIRVRAGPLRL